MRHKGPLISLIAAGFLLAAVVRADDATKAGSNQAAVEAIAAKLPPEVGDAARKWLHGDAKEVKALAAFSPADLEQQVVVALASEPAAADFVLGRLPAETPQTDLLVLKVIALDDFWADDPGVVDGLQRRLRTLLTARIAKARADGDAASLATLAQADERWVMVQHGASLPGFMRRPPRVFAVKPAEAAIRIVGMGDFGSGFESQRTVAAEIVRMGRDKPFDFGVTFGDNFYPSGMKGTDDPRWRDWWEDLYGPLAITFYPSLGNHEWYSDDGAAAEIAYRSPTWDLPAPYYTYTAGPVQFFVVDTTEISEAQVLWLDKAIGASSSKWKVVYGHHPIFAPERNAKAGSYMKYMQARLWPVIRGRVDAYLCGHQHAMAHMDPRDGVHFFMSGGGGAELAKVSKKAPGIMFAESAFGFLTLEADKATMRIGIFDTDGKPFDSEVITK